MMGKRILVADDSRTIQRAFAMVMDGAGYELSFAKSVDEALAMAKRDGKPDLVLSDVALGSGNGYDLCAGIKADAALREVPVYMLASSHNPYDDARGRKVGADGHLAKPFESQALLDAVASVLATPAAPVSAVMPQFSADFNDNTARIAAKDLPVEDDDSYGEITIERGAPPPAAAQPAWAAKPPTRPSAARPVVSAGAAPAPAPSPSPRPSLIPGVRPSAAMPVARTGMMPQPTVPPRTRRWSHSSQSNHDGLPLGQAAGCRQAGRTRDTQCAGSTDAGTGRAACHATGPRGGCSVAPARDFDATRARGAHRQQAYSSATAKRKSGRGFVAPPAGSTSFAATTYG